MVLLNYTKKTVFYFYVETEALTCIEQHNEQCENLLYLLYKHEQVVQLSDIKCDTSKCYYCVDILHHNIGLASLQNNKTCHKRGFIRAF